MTHRCIKPQCSAECYECNQAINEDDDAAMLVCDLLDSWAINGFEQPLEDGENQLVDRARAWLAARRSATLPELPTCTKSQTGDMARPPTPIGWSDTDWIKHLQEHQNAAHPLAGLHINQGSMDAAADAYEAE